MSYLMKSRSAGQESCMELTGKRIIVTGAARGLGKHMAIACIRSGAQVLLTATDRYALEETVGEAQAAADQAVIHLADVRQAAQVDTIVDAARRAFGGVDVLFNNAGIGTGSIRSDFWENPIKFWTITDDDYRRFLQINTLAAVRLACLEAITAVMAADLAGTGVTANVLAPGGPADTRMTMGVKVPPEALIPADCMAAPAVWLSSNASDGVTAKRILGIKWDRTLPPAQAALAAVAPVAWTGFGDQMRVPVGGMPAPKQQ